MTTRRVPESLCTLSTDVPWYLRMETRRYGHTGIYTS